jgi:2'-hydroxyisoflavone reductase
MVSTISVYSDDTGVIDEDSPVGTISDEEVAKVAGMRDVSAERYGPLKALCEQAAEKAMPGKVANVRPGLIVGPDDNSDRFTYWPVRVARGGEVLAPGDPDAGVQFIDVRDLGQWIVALCEARAHGVLNAVGFPGPVTMQEVLHGCKMVSGADCTFTWADADFLREQNVRPWAGPDSLPMWIPGRAATFANRRAIDAGLKFRPIADTIRDTLAWHQQERGASYKWRAGVSADKEAAVLAAWRARASK